MKKDYQMTTVRKYAQLLEQDSEFKEISLQKAVNKYLNKTKQAEADAVLLEELLA